MKIGIDSYCYHRFFGEVYPDQDKPQQNMTMSDFLTRAKELAVDGVSLETCFLETFDKAYLEDLNAQLNEYGFERVWAWGHPDGLERGLNKEAFEQMKSLIPSAKIIGADVMRVTGSSFSFRHENHHEQIQRLKVQFKEAVRIAEDYGVKMAVENHIDFTADEILELLEAVNSPNFGVNFDTGNFLRLLDDPVRGMDILGKYTLAVHLKDLQVNVKEAKPTDWFFFSGVPVGQGLIDNQTLVNILDKSGFTGFLAVEIDHPNYDWRGKEDEAVALSVQGMKNIVANIK
jgi:sugar phosphate isomerase/epimerase